MYQIMESKRGPGAAGGETRKDGQEDAILIPFLMETTRDPILRWIPMKEIGE